MNIILISSFLFAAFLIFLSKYKNILQYIKNLMLALFALIFISSLIIYPQSAVTSASKGITLWLTVVFPALFPFFVASQFLGKTGFVKILGILLEPVMRPLFNVPGCGSFALAMGIISGYPIGASITADLRKENLLTKTEAERLLTFTNNSGPLFIMGAVAVGMFGMANTGYLLYASHIAACITVGLIFKYYKKRDRMQLKSNSSIYCKLKTELQLIRNSTVNPWILFGECIKSSLASILAIGGFVIFFSVLINIIIASGISSAISSAMAIILVKFGLDVKTIEGMICGIFEITTGATLINASPANLKIKLCCTSLIIGWAGLSVHTQVMSIIHSSGISIKPYIVGKAMQGIIASFYTFAGYTLFGNTLLKESPAFLNISEKFENGWAEIFKLHSYSAIIATFVIISIYSICIIVASAAFKKKLFKL